jgi:hypothetical protein
MQYPKYYKCDRTKIVKFNRDYNIANEIEYTYLGLFPSSMNSIQVNYSEASIMTVSVTFTFERYYAGNPDSLAEALGSNNNKQPLQPNREGNLFNAANVDTDAITSQYQKGSATLFEPQGKVSSNFDSTKVFDSKNSSVSTFRVV